MPDLHPIQHQLEEYHLLRRETENRLRQLDLLLALTKEPDSAELRRLTEFFWEPDVPLDQTAQRGSHGPCSAAQMNTSRPQRTETEDLAQTLTAPQRRARAQQEYQRLQRQLAPLLVRNRSRMEQLEQWVGALEGPLEREVLRLRYFDGGLCRLTPWKLVALRLYGDDDPAAVQYVRRLHTLALTALSQTA